MKGDARGKCERRGSHRIAEQTIAQTRLMREVFPVENKVDGDWSAVAAGAKRKNPFVVGEKRHVDDGSGQR